MKVCVFPNVKIMAAVVAGLFVIASTADVEAAKPDNKKPPVVQPVITSVEANLDDKTLRITGDNFADEETFTGSVELFLAETGLNALVVDSLAKGLTAEGDPFQQLVVSGLPANIEDFAGTHLLVVRKGDNANTTSTFPVTIGAVGPAGADGIDGTNGINGVNGINGTNGENGADGQDGADGTNGTNGTNGSDGVGVSQAVINATGSLVITLTDGSEINAGVINVPNNSNNLGDFGTFSIGFTDIGYPQNLPDVKEREYQYPEYPLLDGQVDYHYSISTYEITRNQWLKAIAAGLNVQPAGDWYEFESPDLPAGCLRWIDVAKFVNFLNTTQGYPAAYKIDQFTESLQLWDQIDLGFDPQNPIRNTRARYWIPSVDEWYKAAYYDPNHGGEGVGGYWKYATGSDAPPIAVEGGTEQGTAVIRDDATGVGGFQQVPVTLAGGRSPLGTVGQNGNVGEMTETTWEQYEWGDDPNFYGQYFYPEAGRIIMGGSAFSSVAEEEANNYAFNGGFLSKDGWHGNSQWADPYFMVGREVGFRVAARRVMPSVTAP